MSATEILVLIGGLGLGYWVVSKLYDDLYRDRKSPAPEKGAGQNAPGAAGHPTESDKVSEIERPK